MSYIAYKHIRQCHASVFSMATTFVVDNRERQLVEFFKDRNNLTIAPLDIGDFTVSYDGQVQVIIERKTIPDLAQSIKDNRYREQKTRALAFRAEHPNMKLVYLIEGQYTFEPSFKCHSMSNAILSGSIINTMFRDGVYTIFTKNVSETCEFLTNIMDRFEKEPIKYFTHDKNEPTTAKYADVASVKSSKKENVDKGLCLLQQLCAVPGISCKKAKAIIEHYSATSIAHVCKLIQERPLTDVPGIGKKLAEQITAYIL